MNASLEHFSRRLRNRYLKRQPVYNHAADHLARTGARFACLFSCNIFLSLPFLSARAKPQKQACQTATTTITRTSASTILIVGTQPGSTLYTITPSTKTTTKPPTSNPTGPHATTTVTTTIYTYTTIYVTATPKPTSKTTTKSVIVVSPPPTQASDPNLTKCPVPLYYKCGGAPGGEWNGCSKCVKGAVCTSQNRRYPNLMIDKK
jgi:hypothetical protein